MKRFLFIIPVLLAFWISYSPAAHAQTNCGTNQTIGWHDCGPTTPLIIGCGYSCGGSSDPAGGSSLYSFSGGIWDPIRSRHIAFGGGHNDGGDNSQYAVGIPTNGGTPTSTKITSYSQNTGCSNAFTLPSVPSCDGGVTPNSRHSYNQILYYPPLDAMFVDSGALSAVGNSAGDMWFYYYSGAKAGTWEYLNPNITCIDSSNRNPCQYTYQGVNFTFNPNLPSDNATAGEGGTVAYDSTTQLIWIMDAGGGNLWNYNPSTRVLKQTAGPNLLYFATGDGHNFGVIDSSRHKFWLIANSLLGYVDITSNATANTFHVVSPQPFTATGLSNGIAFDPVSTHIVMWFAGDSFADYNPTTNVAITITYANGPPRPGLADFEGNVFGHFAYAPPPIDAFVANNGANLNEFVLRTRSSTPDTTPPSIPTMLTATAVSQSQINLNWTASTDDSGVVAGYLIEQCQGAGCSNFAQISSVASAGGFSASTLTPSTSYSYRIRAFDASNNLSGYSSTATATTLAPDVIAPTAPTSLSATAVSSSQVNLSWVASTDNVGVVNYFIERCSGDSCANFAQIATTGSGSVTTFSDSTGSGATIYNYRVRASDFANNFSSYSNSASATTQAAPSTILLVDFGSSTQAQGVVTTDATFGLAGWTTPIQDGFTTEIACAGCSNAGGMTNVYNNLGVFNFQGVTTLTSPRTFVPGEVITATFFNNSGASIGPFSPLISFTCNTRPFFCVSPSFQMTSQTIAPGAFGVASYTIDGTSTGTYSVVNVSSNINNLQGIVLDKIVLQPLGSNDVIAPTNPSGLMVSAASTSEIDLTWTASTDASGVTGYFVEQCSGVGCSSFTQIATVSGAPPVTTYANVGLTAGTSYSYRVRATDAAGNLSGYSSTATTLTNANADTSAPTAPSGLTCPVISYRQINCSWTLSTDNVGVASYSIEACPGVGCVNYSVAGIVTAPTTTFSGYIFAPSTTYALRTRASDAAGNVSPYSNVATATTLSTTVLQVGSGKAYATLAAAHTAAGNGDVIEIDSTVSGANVTQDVTKCITIRGVGAPGTYASFLWDGGTYQSGIGANPLPNDQGVFRIFPVCIPPQKVVLDTLEIAGAYGASLNSAAVRVGAGFNIDFLNVYFHDNENGILTGNTPILGDGSASTVTIKNSILARNGNPDGSHQAYIGTVGHLVFGYNKSVDSREGHLLKSRAYVSEIFSNFFSTKDPTFDGSLELDLPNGGDNYVIGNVFEQGTNTGNSAIIKVGEEPPLLLGATNVWNPTNRLYAINNTIYNYRGSGTFVDVTSTGNDFNGVTPPALTFVSENNIFANGGTLYPTSSPTSAITNNTTAVTGDFTNAAAGDYSLLAGKPEINAGTPPNSANGTLLWPTTSYAATASSIPRPVVTSIDQGAYEFGTQNLNIGFVGSGGFVGPGGGPINRK